MTGCAAPPPTMTTLIEEEAQVDVRIGVTFSPKEITVELPENTDGDTVRQQVDKALSGDGGVLWLTDRRGRQVGVPTEKLAYVDIGSPDSDRRIGFGS